VPRQRIPQPEAAQNRGFSAVTELPGEPLSALQLDRLVQRYLWAAGQCQGLDVLEVACGAGVGMGLFARRARRVVAVDIDLAILKRAASRFGSRVPFVNCDAQKLPFRAASFDVVVVFEALYYMPDLAAFLGECRRVLRRDGRLLISAVNPDLFDFNPSALSIRYCGVPQLAAALAKAGYSAKFFGGDDATEGGGRRLPLRWARFIAARLRLIPRSMSRKRLLRRLIHGALHPMPPELTGAEAAYLPLQPLRSDISDHRYRILYAAATVEAP
jgi:SAM-dependent methyltransferase